MTDYEFMLEDRIAKIRAINEQYDLEHNAYISFSGGKDSTILHYLIDMALPNNKIPRVYINTGIEYKLIREFVKEMAKNDDRIKIVNSNVNIKNMLETYGYPFKSKQHSHNWSIYNNNIELDKIIKYLTENSSERFNYDYIHNLPKGIKTIVKYIFGIREKTTDIKHTSKPINKYSKELWFNNYITEFGKIEKDTPIKVDREREREHYRQCYGYNDFP